MPSAIRFRKRSRAKRPATIKVKLEPGVKRERKARVPKPLALATHNFTEWSNAPNLLDINGGATAKMFTFNQIPQWDSYKELFEYFKLNKVVVTFSIGTDSFLPYNDMVSNQNQPAMMSKAEVYYKIDHNDAVPPATLDLFKESGQVRHFFLTDSTPSKSIIIKPSVLKSTTYYSNALLGTTDVREPKWDQWLDASTAQGLEHYGLKMMAKSHAISQPGKVKVEYRLYFSAKNND
jgi:hypothetical protein